MQQEEQQGVNNMRTARIQIITLGLALFVGLGCGKKPFQSLLQEAPTSVTQYEWRLRWSNDSSVYNRQEACYRFLVYKFTAQYQGLIKQADGNIVQEDEKAPRFSYFVYPEAKKICLDYPLSGRGRATNSVKNLDTLCRNGSSDVYRYHYELTRSGLTMVELGPRWESYPQARSYLFVDYRPQNPDQECNL